MSGASSRAASMSASSGAPSHHSLAPTMFAMPHVPSRESSVGLAGAVELHEAAHPVMAGSHPASMRSESFATSMRSESAQRAPSVISVNSSHHSLGPVPSSSLEGSRAPSMVRSRSASAHKEHGGPPGGSPFADIPDTVNPRDGLSSGARSRSASAGSSGGPGIGSGGAAKNLFVSRVRNRSRAGSEPLGPLLPIREDEPAAKKMRKPAASQERFNPATMVLDFDPKANYGRLTKRPPQVAEELESELKKPKVRFRPQSRGRSGYGGASSSGLYSGGSIATTYRGPGR
jgi:hypothetical protein